MQRTLNVATNLNPEDGHDASDIIDSFVDAINCFIPGHPQCFSTKRKTTRSFTRGSPTGPRVDKKSIELLPNSLRVNIHSEPDSTIDLPTAIVNTLIQNEREPTSYRDSKEYLNQTATTFMECPRQLFIKLGRWDTLQKDVRPLSAPLTLDLSSVMAETAPAHPLYLKGFTVHSGNGEKVMGGGHYISYFQKQDPITLAWQ
jgi:hypothetical protein